MRVYILRWKENEFECVFVSKGRMQGSKKIISLKIARLKIFSDKMFFSNRPLYLLNPLCCNRDICVYMSLVVSWIFFKINVKVSNNTNIQNALFHPKTQLQHDLFLSVSKAMWNSLIRIHEINNPERYLHYHVCLLGTDVYSYSLK